jgi:hypothetical protein
MGRASALPEQIKIGPFLPCKSPCLMARKTMLDGSARETTRGRDAEHGLNIGKDPRCADSENRELSSPKETH